MKKIFSSLNRATVLAAIIASLGGVGVAAITTFGKSSGTSGGDTDKRVQIINQNTTNIYAYNMPTTELKSFLSEQKLANQRAIKPLDIQIKDASPSKDIITHKPITHRVEDNQELVFFLIDTSGSMRPELRGRNNSFSIESVFSVYDGILKRDSFVGLIFFHDGSSVDVVPPSNYSKDQLLEIVRNQSPGGAREIWGNHLDLVIRSFDEAYVNFPRRLVIFTDESPQDKHPLDLGSIKSRGDFFFDLFYFGDDTTFVKENLQYFDNIFTKENNIFWLKKTERPKLSQKVENGDLMEANDVDI